MSHAAVGMWGCGDEMPRAGIMRKFLVKIFSKSFEGRRLFEKRRHPKTSIPLIALSGPGRPVSCSFTVAG
ncbi:hypothetical protein [Novacetimonas cocois]|nr:hypothetical protein [Novacetimonas cocois]